MHVRDTYESHDSHASVTPICSQSTNSLYAHKDSGAHCVKWDAPSHPSSTVVGLADSRCARGKVPLRRRDWALDRRGKLAGMKRATMRQAPKEGVQIRCASLQRQFSGRTQTRVDDAEIGVKGHPKVARLVCVRYTQFSPSRGPRSSAKRVVTCTAPFRFGGQSLRTWESATMTQRLDARSRP